MVWCGLEKTFVKGFHFSFWVCLCTLHAWLIIAPDLLKVCPISLKYVKTTFILGPQQGTQRTGQGRSYTLGINLLIYCETIHVNGSTSVMLHSSGSYIPSGFTLLELVPSRKMFTIWFSSILLEGRPFFIMVYFGYMHQRCWSGFFNNIQYVINYLHHNNRNLCMSREMLAMLVVISIYCLWHPSSNPSPLINRNLCASYDEKFGIRDKWKQGLVSL